jgi:signal transduction histidine kinase
MAAVLLKGWLARWDLTPGEQAGMTFGQVLTVGNLRRVEIACLLGLFTRIIEFTGKLRSATTVGHIALMIGFLLASLVVRRSSSAWLARGFVAIFLVVALISSQLVVAIEGAHGRLTSGYLLMILSLTLLFVIPPRLVAAGLSGMFVSYCAIVLDMPASRTEQIVAIENAAIVSGIAVIAAALIHAGRRRDYEQKREIRLQNGRLVERNAELDMLMAITAHDVRSPLYGLRNLFDLTIRRAAEQPDLPLAVLRQALASIDAMLALATRLLDAHAAEHLSLAALFAEDVRGPILAAAGRIGPLAQAADVAIDLDLPDRPLIVPIDAGALAQILDNLLSNAVRHSPAGGTVTIAAAREGPRATITVRDQGPGIDPASRPLLFRKFHRGAAAGSDAVPGAGMGLFIVATLCERMAAAVRCDPVAGMGAVFVVTLFAEGYR